MSGRSSNPTLDSARNVQFSAALRWLFFSIVNAIGSYALTLLFLFLYDEGQLAFPKVMPPLPSGPWPDFLLAIALLSSAFMFEIIFVARTTLVEVQSKLESATRRSVSNSIREAHLDVILSNLLSGIDADSGVRTSAESIAQAIRRFATSVPDRQRPFLMWFVSNRLPEYLGQIHSDLDNGKLQVLNDEQISAIDFQIARNGHMKCIEPVIPQADTDWSEGWRNLMSSISGRRATAEYCFVTTKDELKKNRDAFVAFREKLEHLKVSMYWCDSKALSQSYNIKQLDFDALEWFEDGIFIKSKGLQTPGKWTELEHLQMTVGEIETDPQMGKIVRACDQYRITAREAEKRHLKA